MTITVGPPRTDTPGAGRAPRSLVTAGVLGAVYVAGVGLAALTTLTLVGWIAAPHASLGAGLPEVLRTAGQIWLVAHHTEIKLPHGQVGMLPLGLVVLPGSLLFRAGAWMTRAREVTRLRHAGLAALALAVPYALLAELLAIVGRSRLVQPSPWQAPLTAFLIALVAGGVGALRALAIKKRTRSLWRLLPERPRSLAVGVLAAVLVLVAAGAAVAGVGLGLHLGEARRLTDALSPGLVGGVLLLLLQLAYVPNAVVWGLAYTVGPGFAVGTGTAISPTGVLIGPVPSLPLLAALPDPGVSHPLTLLALAAPFVAGVVGGALTVRAAPTPFLEAAPLWGLCCGAAGGIVTGTLAVFAGGPLGGGRLAAIGPSPWQVGLGTALEVGVAAALAAWLANWLLVRRAGGPEPHPGAPSSPTVPGQAGIVDESDDLGGHLRYVDPFADERDADP